MPPTTLKSRETCPDEEAIAFILFYYHLSPEIKALPCRQYIFECASEADDCGVT